MRTTRLKGVKEPEPNLLKGLVIVYDRALDFNASWDRVAKKGNLAGFSRMNLGPSPGDAARDGLKIFTPANF